MRHIIIATHGELAKGFLHAAHLIMGESSAIALCAYTDENVPFRDIIREKINEKKAGDEIILLTDLLGGSVNNELMGFTKEEGVHLISGINLGLLLQLMVLPEEGDLETMLADLVAESREMIAYCNQIDLDTEDEEL